MQNRQGEQLHQIFNQNLTVDFENTPHVPVVHITYKVVEGHIVCIEQYRNHVM